MSKFSKQKYQETNQKLCRLSIYQRKKKKKLSLKIQNWLIQVTVMQSVAQSTMATSCHKIIQLRGLWKHHNIRKNNANNKSLTTNLQST